eukprot:CAMPEP_0175079288 /NCGR_PEP_ID=MMETSP0052_2-20121109/24732_1 /TAXON_ID=51329 ORGANISM="Polytomella parva, Strain SAG 63-3" /NCGR_SAMPLE_ID=MMETSP0052_2 /ASSEMBLY_ACC=CAM_ASM_000194 /LENGTH=64 /DNA_ID=CAMNT_0016349587 /DNA_START=625 /DNA_END=815 /DNA_ORIENTATION=+
MTWKRTLLTWTSVVRSVGAVVTAPWIAAAIRSSAPSHRIHVAHSSSSCSRSSATTASASYIWRV